MPSYEFQGLTSFVYPETRDAAGRPLGTVNPGDVRDFGAAPDHMWSAVAGGEQEMPADVEAPGEDKAPPEEPAPQPGQLVPPAAIPQ